MQAPFTTPVKVDTPLVCPPAPRRTTRLNYNVTVSQTAFTDKFFVVDNHDVILCEVTHVGDHNGNVMWKRTDNSNIIEASPAQVSLANADERIVSWGQL